MTNRVSRVELKSPAITVTANGARISSPSPTPNHCEKIVFGLAVLLVIWVALPDSERSPIDETQQGPPALSDKAQRKDLSFRRKQDDARYPINLELGLQGTELLLPMGVIQGQKLDLILRELTLDVSLVSYQDTERHR